MTDTIINSARKAHKSSIKSVNAKIKRVQRQIQQIKDDYIEDAITYEEYCHLSRQFIHTEPFLELEREEMIQENKCLAPIEQRIEEISQPFEEKMARLTSELSDMFKKSHELEEEIRKKLGAIGYEI